MKQWVQKLVDQLNVGWDGTSSRSEKGSGGGSLEINDDRATLLYVIDTYNKHLIEVEGHPVRKVRETLDEFAKELVHLGKNTDRTASEKVLFRFRQFFSAYRVDEYTYLRKTFEDFKGIIWDFVDQLAEDFQDEQAHNAEINENLEALKEAVEADSIDMLRAKSREFIDSYIERTTRREEKRTKRIKGIKKNLDSIQKKLDEANHSMRVDHLTGAFNRRSFDEHLKQQRQNFTMAQTPVSMILMDIDFFKKINDTYGHDIGDFVLKECVRTLQETFSRESDFVARVGGEEFAVVLTGHNVQHAVKRAEDAMARIRKEVFVTQNMELRFTVSMGIAQLLENESVDQWIKRSDEALYQSKHGGRNRYTIAPHGPQIGQVA